MERCSGHCGNGMSVLLKPALLLSSFNHPLLFLFFLKRNDVVREPVVRIFGVCETSVSDVVLSTKASIS